MADLRTRFATLDRLPVPDLWAEVERRAMAGAMGEPTKVAARQPMWRLGQPTLAPASNRRFVFVLVVLGLLLAAIVGVALVGGLLPDTLRAELPQSVPSPATEASATPVVATATFNSRLYGYSMAYPASWQADHAAQPWLGSEPPGDSQVDSFSLPFSPNSERFTVASRSMFTGWTEDRWVQTFLPLPQEVKDGTCTFGVDGAGSYESIVRDSPEPQWIQTFVAGHPAIMRSICGHVDVVAFIDDRVFMLSLFSRSGTEGDASLFRRLADTFELSDPAVPASPSPSPTPRPSLTPLPEATETFESTKYDYTIRYPADWSPTPAKVAWVDAEPWRDAMADEFAGPDGRATLRFSVVARDVESGWSQDQQAWIDAYVPLSDEYVAFAAHGQGTHGHCFFRRGGGTTMLDGSTPQWESGTLSGKPAHVRAACGRIDGVVFAGSKAFVLTLYEDTLRMARLGAGAPNTSGNPDLFEVFTDTFAVDESLVAPVLEPTLGFSSDTYGYSLRYPDGWSPRPAITSWTGEQAPTSAMVDALTVQADPRVRFSVASRVVAPGTTEAAWIDVFVAEPARYLVGDDGFPACDVPGRYEARATSASSSWTETTIGRYPGRVRWVCDRIDGVVFAGGRAYLLSYVVDGSYLGDGKPLAFAAFADTFVIDP